MAQIVFGRLQVGPIRVGFNTAGVDGHQPAVDAGDPGFAEQLLDDPLRLVVSALAESMMSYPSLGIDDVERRPVVVLEGTPDLMVAVDRDRIVDPHGLR